MASMRQLRMGQPNLPVSLPRIFTLQVGANGGNTIIGTSVVGPKPAAVAAAAAFGAAAVAVGGAAGGAVAAAVGVLRGWLNSFREPVQLQGPATLRPRSISRMTAAAEGIPMLATNSLLLPPLLHCRCFLPCCSILQYTSASVGLSGRTRKVGSDAAMASRTQPGTAGAAWSSSKGCCQLQSGSPNEWHTPSQRCQSA